MSSILQANINFYASAYAVFTGPSYSPVLLGFLFRYLGVVVHSPLTHDLKWIRLQTSSNVSFINFLRQPTLYYHCRHQYYNLKTKLFQHLNIIFINNISIPSLQVRQNLYKKLFQFQLLSSCRALVENCQTISDPCSQRSQRAVYPLE